MRIGLITYHSAYNFGSVLQAYATQEIIREITGSCEVINYRSREQRKVYSIYKWDKGMALFKSLVKNVLSIPNYGIMKNRANKYEQVINDLFTLSEECVEPEDVYGVWKKYDIIVSGSDQIWNKHSNELENISWEYMFPYLLHGYEGKKVSYASSITNMSDEEIEFISADLKKFDYISVRESSSSKKLNKEYNLNTINAIDPTFLLRKDEWITKLNLKKDEAEKYILFYVLCRHSEIKDLMSTVKKIAATKKISIKMIVPLNNIRPEHGIEILQDVDPIDFMNLIYNATAVITDSYHGTILSVNLQKDIYSVCKGFPSDFRKVDILEGIGLQDRIIRNPEVLLFSEYPEIDYESIISCIDDLRMKSIGYLKMALER